MSETALKIRVFGDSGLRKRSKSVKVITQQHRETLSRMGEIMYANAGIGLAAPQIGINESMIVVDIGQGLIKLINPGVTKKEGTQAMEEGCLSVPGVCITVKRAKKISVSAMDEFAKPVTIDAEGLFACVLQHEIDHLKGKLIVDYASFFDRFKIGGKLERLKRKAKDERLSEQGAKSCKLQL